MLDVFELEPAILVDRMDSYIISYPYILNYFERDGFSVSDFVCGAHMIYGWMPTILQLHPEEVDLQSGVNILNGAKRDGSECR